MLNLDGFNEKQLEAVTTIEGPLLILAGAGTGKTKVLVTRIANIIESGAAFPSQILGVTFTNKAANEMKQRLRKLTSNIDGIWLGTFHSICARLLRVHFEAAELKQNFTIVDEDEKLSVLKSVAEQHNLDTERKNLRVFSKMISQIKEKGISYDDEKVANFQTASINIASIYEDYQARLKFYNLVDFDDLLLYVVKIMERNEDILAKIQNQFKYVLVDEYQDTSHIQHKLLQIIASQKSNICCVGDEDQSIYGWRGAEVENILNFPKQYKDAKIIKLEQNYRSTNAILQVASSVISNNKSRYGKTLFSKFEIGDKVNIIKVQDNNHEGSTIVKHIKDCRDTGYEYSDMAILVRASHQMRGIEDALMHNKIPYKIVDGVKFYDRKEIKDMISYLRIVFSETDRPAFERIVNTPKRGIGNKGLETIINICESNHIAILKGARIAVDTDALSGKQGKSLCDLLERIEKWKMMLMHEGATLSTLAECIAHESGYISMLQDDAQENPAEKNRIENIHEFVAALDRFDSLEQFLEEVALFNAKDTDADAESVNVLTMHGAKGLEYDVVFLPCWESGVFPSVKSVEERGDEGEEEERRLAYVAITRAKKRVYITHAQVRTIFGKTQSGVQSVFIREIADSAPEDSVKFFDLSSFGGDWQQKNGRGGYGGSGGYGGAGGYGGSGSGNYNKNFGNGSSGAYGGNGGSGGYGGGYGNYGKQNQPSREKPRFVASDGANKKVSSIDDNISMANISVGDDVSHATLGDGRVLQLIGQYANVDFTTGEKRLVHKRFLSTK